MSIKFAKRAAGQILNRGESSIRINQNSLQDAAKAITKEDVRALISNGGIYAIPAKHNVSMNSKTLRKKRSEGRRRGKGRRRGTSNARSGSLWKKKVRSQRILLKRLKLMGKLSTKDFQRYYKLIKGNSFADKSSLLMNLSENGIKVSAEELKQVNDYVKSLYQKKRANPQAKPQGENKPKEAKAAKKKPGKKSGK